MGKQGGRARPEIKGSQLRSAVAASVEQQDVRQASLLTSAVSPPNTARIALPPHLHLAGQAGLHIRLHAAQQEGLEDLVQLGHHLKRSQGADAAGCGLWLHALPSPATLSQPRRLAARSACTAMHSTAPTRHVQHELSNHSVPSTSSAPCCAAPAPGSPCLHPTCPPQM